MTTRASLALALVFGLATSGCLRASFERHYQLHPVAKEQVATLVPGETSLEECLAQLGAPLWVRERQTYGTEIAYGWSKASDWGLSLSLPVTEHSSASFNYDEIDSKLRGVVLLFDEDWRLEVVRAGYLRELVAPEVRPAYIDPDDSGA
jgi:hypothetical protein